jgi:hypothetical protein
MMQMARDTLADVPDETLLVPYANGDANAARLLMQRLLLRTLGFAARILSGRSEAEDVAQDVMLRLWRVDPADAVGRLGSRLGCTRHDQPAHGPVARVNTAAVDAAGRFPRCG